MEKSKTENGSIVTWQDPATGLIFSGTITRHIAPGYWEVRQPDGKVKHIREVDIISVDQPPQKPVENQLELF